MWASQEGHIEIVGLLLAKGAEVNLQGSEGETALSLSSQRDRLEVVNTLLAHGSDVNLPDHDGWTALMWASQEGQIAVPESLRDEAQRVRAAPRGDRQRTAWQDGRG